MEIRSKEELQAFAANFAKALAPLPGGATVVTLSGDLGAGKTTFTQAVAHALGVEEDVTSPTFVIEKIYILKGQRFERLIHIDAYRLESSRELEVLGFSELVQDPSNLILIEWPERVADIMPASATRLILSGNGDARELTILSSEE